MFARVMAGRGLPRRVTSNGVGGRRSTSQTRSSIANTIKHHSGQFEAKLATRLKDLSVSNLHGRDSADALTGVNPEPSHSRKICQKCAGPCKYCSARALDVKK